MSFAAGIIPYTIINRQPYFLLGLETSNNKWSGFVGGSEPGENPINTAFREFTEETAMVFDYAKDYIQSEILTNHPVTELTATGKIVYLWFVKFPEKANFSQFYKNKSKLDGAHFKEKSELCWFSLSDIENKNVLYKLKKTIKLIYSCEFPLT